MREMHNAFLFIQSQFEPNTRLISIYAFSSTPEAQAASTSGNRVSVTYYMPALRQIICCKVRAVGINRQIPTQITPRVEHVAKKGDNSYTDCSASVIIYVERFVSL